MTAIALPRLDHLVDDAPLFADVVLPRIAAATPDARQWLRETLKSWSVDFALVEDAELLFSEVFTNSVRHAIGDDFDTRATVSWWNGHLRATVSDPDPRFYAANPGDPEHGRGLAIVDALATRWGTVPNGDGKVTFYELHSGGTL